MIIYPPHAGFDKIATTDQVIFLAGPIQGAVDWQSTAGDILDDTDRVIANPRGPTPWHGDYNGQVDWETWHLERAAKHGVILFWLAKQAVHFCDRPHGQTSRFELGEWVSAKRYSAQPFNLVIGIESGFTNENYIRRRLSKFWPHTLIPTSLEETCQIASRAF